MRISEFKRIVDRAMAQNDQVMAVGPAGIGKTQVPEDFAREHHWGLGSVCMPMVDPPTLQGYPARDGATALHLPFGILAEAMQATSPYLIVMDEFGSASTSTMKAGLRLMQFREVCGKRLPECVRIIALSNDIGHGADIQGIIEPMKGRFMSIINVEPNLEDTIIYGLSRQWPAWLLAFLRNSPDSLCDYTPIKSMQVGGSDPRAWENVARMELHGYLDDPCALEMICGRVGKGHGAKALAYRGLVGQLPDISNILLDPDGAPVPSDPSAQYLVAMTLASILDGNTFGQAIKYLKRLPQILQAFSVKDACRAESARREMKKLPPDHKPITASRDWTAWTVSQDGKDIMSVG